VIPDIKLVWNVTMHCRRRHRKEPDTFAAAESLLHTQQGLKVSGDSTMVHNEISFFGTKMHLARTFGWTAGGSGITEGHRA
jgi:hypothetical protein